MFNWKKMSLVLLAAVSLLSGCTKSNIVSPEGGTRADTDSLIQRSIKILKSTGWKCGRSCRTSIWSHMVRLLIM